MIPRFLYPRTKNWTKNTWIMIEIETIYSKEVGRELGKVGNSRAWSMGVVTLYEPSPEFAYFIFHVLTCSPGLGKVSSLFCQLTSFIC